VIKMKNINMKRIFGSKFTLLIAALGLVAFVGQGMADTLSVKVAASSDDAEQDSGSGTVDLGSSDLELAFEGPGDNQQTGMRFLGINIPAGSRIDSAYIQFTVDEIKEDLAAQVLITGESTPNPSTFLAVVNDISNRPRTAAVVWEVPSWQIPFARGPDQRSADLSTIVTDLIGQGGWAAGNAMVFFSEADTSFSNQSFERIARSYDISSTDAPELTINFTLDTDGDGVHDDIDACPGTSIPESVPTQRLGTNRWALVNDDKDFDTTSPMGEGPGRSYSMTDTAGCSCEQIITALGLGKGHGKFGCSISAMDEWVALPR
jgi:hypothetical protein